MHVGALGSAWALPPYPSLIGADQPVNLSPVLLDDGPTGELISLGTLGNWGNDPGASLAVLTRFGKSWWWVEVTCPFLPPPQFPADAGDFLSGQSGRLLASWTGSWRRHRGGSELRPPPSSFRSSLIWRPDDQPVTSPHPPSMRSWLTSPPSHTSFLLYRPWVHTSRESDDFRLDKIKKHEWLVTSLGL